jgi:hypothetical protein
MAKTQAQTIREIIRESQLPIPQQFHFNTEQEDTPFSTQIALTPG